MKVIAAVLIAASLTGTLTMNAQAAPRSRTIRHHGPCSGRMAVVRPNMSHALITRRVDKMVRCAFSRWSGDVPRGLCTADRESGDWPWASNGTHDGIFQHATTYWTSRANAYLREDWFPRMRGSSWTPSAFNARANILVSARMVDDVGWSPWAGGCV